MCTGVKFQGLRAQLGIHKCHIISFTKLTDLYIVELMFSFIVLMNVLCIVDF